MSKRIRELLVVIIAMTVVIALFMGYQRYEYEMRTKNVEIAVNFNDIESFAQESGRKLPQELALFKAPGVTTIFYKEETLADLKKYLTIYYGEDFLLNQDKLVDEKTKKQLLLHNELNYDYTYIFVQDETVSKRILKNIGDKNPEASLHSYDITTNGHPAWLIVTSATSTILGNLGFGFDSNLISYFESINLQVLPQVRTWNNPRAKGVETAFSDLEGHKNINTILFNDKSLPGYPDKDRLAVINQILRRNNWSIGLIEFMDQKGFNEVAYANAKKVVRFFSIDTKESDKTTPEDALDKYTLAASERNDKIIFVRPVAFKEVDQEQGYINHLDAVRRGLAAKGLNVIPINDNVNFPVSQYPTEFLVLFMSIGVIAGGLFLADKLGLYKIGIVCAIVLFFIVFYLSFSTVNGVFDKIDLAEKGMALLAAIIFPTYGLLVTISRQDRNILQSMGAFVQTSLISLVGGVFVVGFLADKAYMVKIDQYMGIKLAHLIPIAIILIYLYFNEKDGKNATGRTTDLLKEPLTFGYAILSIALLGAIAIYIIRTGNDAAGLVSGTELKFRAILDNILYVRPRTKEFLIGHPFLIALYYLGYKFRYLPFVALAVIGQVSIVDTFAHIHTPIIISIMRTFNGMWLGVALGIACIIAYVYYFKNWGSESK